MSKLILKKTHEDQILWINLNFPEKNNILSLEIIEELKNSFNEASKDLQLKAIVLSGNGSHFCSGGDLNWMRFDTSKTEKENKKEIESLFDLFYTMYNCPIPLIAQAHGSVYGGGLGLLAVCDLVIALKDTKFCFSEIKLALIPSTISPFILRKMSFSALRSFMLTGSIFGTNQALKEGLIHFSGDSKDCKEQLNQWIKHFALSDREACYKIKKLLDSISHLSIEDSKDHCINFLLERKKSKVAMERIDHFLNKKNKK